VHVAQVTFDLHKAAQNFLHPSGRRVRPLEQANPFVECGIAELPPLRPSPRKQKLCVCLPELTPAYGARSSTDLGSKNVFQPRESVPAAMREGRRDDQAMQDCRRTEGAFEGQLDLN
jgi:hypothetical protein